MIKGSKNKEASLGKPIGFSIVHSQKGWVSSSPKNFGKWIVLDKNPEKLKKHKEKLNELVEEGEITQVKFYNIKKMNERGVSLLPERKKSVLMVYCNDDEKKKVKKLLENLGLHPENWKSNKQTREDWKPGGELFEEMKETLPKEKFDKYIEKIAEKK